MKEKDREPSEETGNIQENEKRALCYEIKEENMLRSPGNQWTGGE